MRSATSASRFDIYFSPARSIVMIFSGALRSTDAMTTVDPLSQPTGDSAAGSVNVVRTLPSAPATIHLRLPPAVLSRNRSVLPSGESPGAGPRAAVTIDGVPPLDETRRNDPGGCLSSAVASGRQLHSG